MVHAGLPHKPPQRSARPTAPGAHLTSRSWPRMGVCPVAISHSTTPASKLEGGSWVGMWVCVPDLHVPRQGPADLGLQQHPNNTCRA